MLAAKIQMQWLPGAARVFDGPGHLSKDVDIRAAKAVDGLFAIADDEEVCSGYQSDFVQQVALQTVSVLKFINQKISIAI